MSKYERWFILSVLLSLLYLAIQGEDTALVQTLAIVGAIWSTGVFHAKQQL